jgi:hypothetical protein
MSKEALFHSETMLQLLRLTQTWEVVMLCALVLIVPPLLLRVDLEVLIKVLPHQDFQRATRPHQWVVAVAVVKIVPRSQHRPLSSLVALVVPTP